MPSLNPTGNEAALVPSFRQQWPTRCRIRFPPFREAFLAGFIHPGSIKALCGRLGLQFTSLREFRSSFLNIGGSFKIV
jgi:hypothetical protein